MEWTEVAKVLGSGLLGGVVGNYLGARWRDGFERRKRGEDRERLRRALYKDLTALFSFLVRVQEHVFDTVHPVVTDFVPWNERKIWLPPRLKSLAFTHAEEDILLFLEIEKSERLHRTFTAFSTFMDDDRDDRLRFSTKLYLACCFFEDGFKRNLIDQELVLENATPAMRKKLIELKEGNRSTITDCANQILARYDPGEFSRWWAAFEPPLSRDEGVWAVDKLSPEAEQ